MPFFALLLSLLLFNTLAYSMEITTNREPKSFNFKLLTEADLPLLFKWFQQPYIAKLWVEPKEWTPFKEKYAKRLSSKEIFPFLAFIGEEPIAYIKYHFVSDEDRALFPDVELPKGSIGLDLFIGNPEYVGKGFGTQLLKEFISFLKKVEPKCTTIIIDPAPDNDRAIACYKKVGFKTIGPYEVPYGPTGQGPGPILLMVYTYS
jgi:RimJ/RimL family protein N-acetyltransferase